MCLTALLQPEVDKVHRRKDRRLQPAVLPSVNKGIHALNHDI